MKIPFKKLNENARKPEYQYANDVGADVYMTDTMIIKKGENIIPLGFSAIIPSGCAAFLCLRSSWMGKGLICNFTPIDPDYSGEYHLCVYNVSDKDIIVEKGERICQVMLFSGVNQVEFVDEDDICRRSSGSFGSTGRY